MDSHIIVQPSTFVVENQNNFQEVYRLSKLIGTGKFGEVRICYHRVSGQKRAVKIIRKDLLTSAHQKNTLDNEINVLKQLDHPNIVRINEFFEDLRRLYIVMEYCKGGELFSEIMKRGKVTENHSASIMKQIFLTLEYLHNKGIVHRDIKSENILLEDKHDILNIKIIDFGSAIINKTRLKIRGSAGTTYYMSPEILTGNYSFLCDMWSAGVILYILLAGFPPFDGKNHLQIAENIKNYAYDLTVEPWSNISTSAKNLIKKLLCPENERISAKEALEDEWIQKSLSPLIDGNKIHQVLQNLRKFRATSILRDAIQTYIMSQYISANDTKDLKEIFMVIDVDHDGKISQQELKNEYLKIMDEVEAEKIVQKVMDEVDSDKNGYIEYSEFLKANLDNKKIMSKENLNAAFRMFDKDEDGKINAEEVKNILQGGNEFIDIQIWRDILQEFDINGNGEIDLNEFSQLLKTVSENGLAYEI